MAKNFPNILMANSKQHIIQNLCYFPSWQKCPINKNIRNWYIRHLVLSFKLMSGLLSFWINKICLHNLCNIFIHSEVIQLACLNRFGLRQECGHIQLPPSGIDSLLPGTESWVRLVCIVFLIPSSLGLGWLDELQICSSSSTRYGLRVRKNTTTWR